MLNGYLQDACFYLKGNGEVMVLGERARGGKIGVVEKGKAEVKMQYIREE